MRIFNLRTNHLETPLGYKLDSPIFTWTVEQSTGLRQAAARIEVATDDRFEKVIFDSGATSEASSLGFVPAIAPAPRTRYHWRVTVWAEDGDTASAQSWFETGKMDEAWQGQWIKADFDKEIHPILAKEIELPAKAVSARVYATGLGVYELYVNGVKAGDEVLSPLHNDYNLWLQAQVYDVTELLKPGANTLSMMLGNGWYRGRFGFIDKLDKLYGDQMQALAELRVVLEDGTEQVVGTDESWLAGPSPVLESSIYDGEVYDARLEGRPQARPVRLAEAPQGALTDRMSPPVRVIERVKPARLLHTPAGESVIDFGQVMTGWCEFDCDLPEGARLFLQYGELLQNDNFYNENLRTAKQEYKFISAGRPAHARPRFTFYGFRYVKVEGLESVNLEDFTGCVIHSDLPMIGSLVTSNEKVNRLILNAKWGQRGNFLDVPTDCPQRDERMGWTGDAQVFAPTAAFTMYTPAFYDKYLYDMRLEQRTLGGSVPHVVPDILGQIGRITNSKSVFNSDAHGSCAWADAATVIPWTMYLFYGDENMLARQYENMTAWSNWIHSQDDGSRLWTTGFHFADWLALDNPVEGSCLGGTDPYFVASAYYYYSTHLTALAAQALGKAEDYGKYESRAEEIKAAFRKEFFTRTGRIAVPTQTALALALYLDLAPEGDRPRLIADLKKRIEDRDNHLDTGFVGTYFLCPTLSQNGLNEVAYTLLLNEDFPSWLYEVNMGATTVWERWNSVLPNGLVSDTGMNSMNHYAYGAVVEWMYRTMCGLNPVPEHPGFKRALIAPQTDARFESAKAVYESAAGRYESGWRRLETGIEYTVEVPFDAQARFVPDARGPVTVNGRPAKLEGGALILDAGRYVIAVG